MTIRTFTQKGQGYGSSATNITVLHDGVEIFSGAVPTLDQPLPNPGDVVHGSNLYSWTNTVDFSGNIAISIAVSNGALLLTESLADHIQANTPSDTGSFFDFQPPDNANVTVSEPLVNVEISGSPQLRTYDPPGQWYYTIPAGSTLTAIMRVNPGVEPAP